MASLTPFQKKKITHIFERLYDTNGDGVIEKCDFDEALEKVTSLHHWSKDEGAFTKAKEQLNRVWDGLKEVADKNKDGRITKEEWEIMWANTIQEVAGGKPFPGWQQEYMEFMFYANDTSGDGFIDREEYTTVYQLFGFSNGDVNVCFDKISQGCEGGLLSKEAFEGLWREYITTDDAAAKGNSLFGNL